MWHRLADLGVGIVYWQPRRPRGERRMDCLGKQARAHKPWDLSHVDDYADHMSWGHVTVTQEREGVCGTYKYVIAVPCPAVPLEPPTPYQRPSCKSCLKVSQLLICTTPILHGLVLASRWLSICDFRRLTLVLVHSSTDNVVGVLPRAHHSHKVILQGSG